MTCPNCQAVIDDNAAVCIHCGQSINVQKGSDSARAGWWWLGFFFPVLGFILWACWSGVYPKKAKRVGIGAIVGTIISVLLVIAVYVGYFFLLFSLSSRTIGYM